MSFSGPEKGDINMDFGSREGPIEQKGHKLELKLRGVGTGKEKGNERLRN